MKSRHQHEPSKTGATIKYFSVQPKVWDRPAGAIMRAYRRCRPNVQKKKNKKIKTIHGDKDGAYSVFVSLDSSHPLHSLLLLLSRLFQLLVHLISWFSSLCLIFLLLLAPVLVSLTASLFVCYSTSSLRSSYSASLFSLPSSFSSSSSPS